MGRRWVPDTRTDWQTDRQSQNNFSLNSKCIPNTHLSVSQEPGVCGSEVMLLNISEIKYISS
jgi:hypothetical protein